MFDLYQWRMFGAVSIAALSLSGCSINGTYPDATEPDAAKLRFISSNQNSTMDVFDAAHCGGQTTGLVRPEPQHAHKLQQDGEQQGSKQEAEQSQAQLKRAEDQPWSSLCLRRIGWGSRHNAPGCSRAVRGSRGVFTPRWWHLGVEVDRRRTSGTAPPTSRVGVVGLAHTRSEGLKVSRHRIVPGWFGQRHPYLP